MSILPRSDPELSAFLQAEERRQMDTINLIAAENYASKAVLEAQGSLLTNKYAEGYPHRRYYGGCERVDMVENLAIQRAKELFQAEHANVQPHSGAQANMAAYFTLLQPGDTAMAMSLAHGGHLTHGSEVNFSGNLYKFITYGVNRETERLDYDEIERLAIKHRPKLIVAGASAYSRVIDFERFGRIASLVGARLLADMAHLAGMVAAGLHPTPVPCADVVTSTSHKTLRGPRGGFVLCKGELASLIDAAVFPGMQGGPLMHVIAAKAVAFHEAMQPEFVSYQHSVMENAAILAGELQRLGLRIVSGGTDNHLILINLTKLDFSGRQAQEALETANIYVNRNIVPNDPRSKWETSGIRIGTPAVTTKGLKEKEIKQIGLFISQILKDINNQPLRQKIKQEVIKLAKRFPVL